MRKRILLRLCLLILIAGAGFCLLVWFIPSPRINMKAFGELRNGMSKAEVWAVLNCEPGDYGGRTPEFQISTRMPEWQQAAPTARSRVVAEATEQWTSAKAAIRVWYDGEDRMVLGVFQGTGDDEPGLLDCVWRWLSSLGGRNDKAVFTR